MNRNLMMTAAILAALMLILTFSGCGGNVVSTPSGNTPAASAGDAKILLELVKFSQSEPDDSEAAEFSFTPRFCSIPASDLTETVDSVYSGDESLADFAKYVSDSFGIDLDERWTYTVHYYDNEHTAGMVKFIYRIGNRIETNKAIIFYINDGAATQVTCSYLSSTADEQALIEKLDIFLSTHEQEKGNILGEGFSICGDSTHYIYNYRTEKLTYCYTIFYMEDESGVIINDFGTEAVIE